MIVAGLTGGIATGKSTVAAIFAAAGACIVDADRIAREAVRKDAPAYHEVCARFGTGILLPDGEIDRKHLAQIIFADPAAQRALEGIIHPRVGEEIARQVQIIGAQQPEAVAILDIPLLFESGMQRGLAAIIVVYVPEQIQMERLMARDGLSQPEALSRLRAQMPIETKKSLATHVIDNSGTLAHTRLQTLDVLRRLKN